MATEQHHVSGEPAHRLSTPDRSMEGPGRELASRADTAGGRLTSGVRGKAHAVVSGVRGGRARVAARVQTKPMQTLLWAAGIGVFTGLLLGRRARRNHRSSTPQGPMD